MLKDRIKRIVVNYCIRNIGADKDPIAKLLKKSIPVI